MSAAVEERAGVPAQDLPVIPRADAGADEERRDGSDVAVQERAERAFWRDGMIGAAIGMVVCAGIWMAIVAVALVGAGWSLGGPLLMAAGIGLFAGAFLGGWAGVMVGAARLEKAERELLHRRHG